jgi:glycosyltransferase involved in cell wall biosynthesis
MTGDVKAILFVSHVNPALRSGGNETRILKMMNWLRQQGCFLVLLLNSPPLSEGKREALLKIVDRVYTPDECPVSIPRKLANAFRRVLRPEPAPVTESENVRAFLGRRYLAQATGVLCRRYRPQAVIAEYVFTAPCLQEVPHGSLKIVDTHGVFSRRKPGEPTYCTEDEERGYLLNADVVIAIQPEEAVVFRSLVPERTVLSVGVDYDVADPGGDGGIRGETVMVVGTNYPANIAGLKAFCEHAWPIVRGIRPDAELLVAGKIREAVGGDIPGVKVLGWVDDLKGLYRQSAVVINPTMSGVGLKIKTVEALCNGKALVATPNAVEGLDFDGKPPCVVCGDWPDFASAVVSLLADPERREEHQEAAIRFARDRFSGSRVYAPLKNLLWKHDAESR